MTPSLSSALPDQSHPHIELRARIDALNDDAWPIRFSDRERAETLAREALGLAEAAEYPAGIALALRTLGVQRQHFKSDYEGALDLLDRALALLDEAGEVRGRADVLNGIGHVHLRQGEHARAVGLHLEALRIQRSLGDQVGEGSSLNLLGIATYRAGEYGAALEHHQGALALREQAGDRAGAGNVLINIGVIHGELGEFEQLLECMGRALHYLDGQDPQAVGACLCNMGDAYASLGDLDRALEFLERAGAELRAIDSADEAVCLMDLGRVHEKRGDDETARTCYVRALELVHRSGASTYEPEILIHLGALEARLGKADAGLGYLHDALRIAETQGARQPVYAAHEALAKTYEARGDTARALEHHRAFYAVWREVFSTETSQRIQNARIREEVRQTEREAEILREKNEALTRADEEKARLLDQLRIQAAELERQTREDALTGVSNRRHLDDLLAAEWERAHRFRRALSVAMVDVDHFKQVNDRFSHAAGDEVLRTVARILREHTRGVDVVARYGGEEFCLVLVETAAAEAAPLCDRLRALVQAHDWTSLHPGLAVTVSIGVAEMEAGLAAPAALLAAADARLYAAKHAGRNRVCAG
jgi:diguanylate cyclase (GGDEF)-like protein